MKVEIISRETIRPSSPTPSHLRIFKTSLLDQIIGVALVRFICYYQCRDENLKSPEILNHLKTSLSETLTRYYPLAGVGIDSSTIDCNDKGAVVVTAQVNCSLEELIGVQPKFEHFHKLGTSSKFYEDGDSQVSVQFNIFSCGAIGIFCCFSHRISDATTICSFLKCWAAIARGSPELAIFPEYKSALLFPPSESVPHGFSIMSRKLLLTESKSVRRRFVFDAAAISKLKARGSTKHVPNPTTIEVVSSFIWKHATAAAKAARGLQHLSSTLIHAANLRGLMIPPLPEHSAGNLAWLICADYDATDQKNDIQLPSLVETLRREKQKYRDEFVPKLQTEHYEALKKYSEEMEVKCGKENWDLYVCSSWCKMGINEVDFGWGMPNWCSLVGGTEAESVIKNMVNFVDGRSSDGVEAWLLLEQREMAVLESNEEFLTYASSNPGISFPNVTSTD